MLIHRISNQHHDPDQNDCETAYYDSLVHDGLLLFGLESEIVHSLAQGLDETLEEDLHCGRGKIDNTNILEPLLSLEPILDELVENPGPARRGLGDLLAFFL